MFHNFNSYLHWFITIKVVNEVKNDFNKQIIKPTPYSETTEGKNSNIRKPMMIQPYAGGKGCTLIKSLKRNLSRALPTNIQTRIVYTRTNSSSQLKNIKDPTPFEEQHDIVYHSFCSTENCNKNYIGESARRLNERINYHNCWDCKSHFFKHSVEIGHDPVLKKISE